MVSEVIELSAPAPGQSTERMERRRNVYPALLAALTLTAAVLRIYAISSKSFWFDEIMGLENARLPWPLFLRALGTREANMAPYYLLLRYWLHLGQSEGIVRALSVLFSVATVPILYALGRRLFDRRTGLLAALLLSINAFHIRYAQEARSYAMVVFLVTLGTWLLVRNLQQPSSAHWGVYSAICVLAVYGHFYAGLVIAAQLGALAVLPRKDVPWKTIARHLCWFALMMIPIAVILVRTGTGPIGWTQPFALETLLNFGFNISGNYGRPLLILNVIAIGLAFTAASRAWAATHRAKDVWSYWLLFLWLFAPVAIVFVASIASPVFMARYLNPCLPAMTLLAAAGIAKFRPAILGWLLFAAISLCSILGTVSYYRRDFDVGRQPWRAATSYVFDHAQPGDTMFFYLSGAQLPFDFYGRERNPPPEWPKPLNPPYYDVAWNENEFQAIPGTDVPAARPSGNRVWLVLLLPLNPSGMPNMTDTRVRDWFAAGRHRVDVQNLYPLSIVLFANDAVPSNPAPSHTP